MAEDTINIGKRGSTPNFDIQWFCSPLSYKDAYIVSHLKVLNKDQLDLAVMKHVTLLLRYFISAQNTNIFYSTTNDVQLRFYTKFS